MKRSLGKKGDKGFVLALPFRKSSEEGTRRTKEAPVPPWPF